MLRTIESAINIEAQSWLHSYEPLATQAMGLLNMVDATLRPITTIVCTKCRVEKPYTDFPSSALQNQTKHCKRCHLDYQKEWHRLNPEKAAERRAKQYAKWREKYPKIERPPAITEEGRLCGSCKQRKPPEAFRRNVLTTDRRMWRCRDCLNMAHRRWSTDNREHVRDSARGSTRSVRSRNRVRANEVQSMRRLQKTHGITWEEYLALIAAHDGKCAICQREVVPIPSPERAKCACVDHDHGTGQIRGILCHACNRAIGMLRDDTNLLRSAISYLEGGYHRKRPD